MADPHLTPLGTAVKMFFTEVIDAAKRGYKYEKKCRILLECMNKLQPHIDAASQNSADWDKAQSDGLKEIKDLLDMVRRHATNCILLEKRKRLMTFCPRLAAELDDIAHLALGLDDFVHLQAERDDFVHPQADLDDVVILSAELDDIVRLPPGLDEIFRLRAELNNIVRRIEKAQQTIVFVAALENLSCVDALEKIESFVPQQLPSDIVGLDVPFNKLKASILAGCSKGKPSHLGLHGRGGVGKTLLAQMLHNDEDIIEKYGAPSILWITVGLHARVSDVYNAMGQLLKDGAFVEKYAHQSLKDQRGYLWNAFAQKKVFLILDDVWQEQGIQNHGMMYWLNIATAAGSVTLITTRSSSVLSEAHAESEVVLTLSEYDSWKLFCSHAFHNGPPPSTISKELAKEVSKKCKGLPLALKVVGRAMVDKVNKKEWYSILQDLKQSKQVLDELFGRLRSSYDELKDDVLKTCFLYFAAFPEGCKIPTSTLFNIWISERLFGSIDANNVKNKAQAHLEILEKHSLIHWDRNREYVKVLDILYDLAFYIIDKAEPGECAYECFFHSREVFGSLSSRKSLEEVKRMSLMNSSISEWPKNLQAPLLQVCLLSGVIESNAQISDNFFSNMTSLKYLNISLNFNHEGKLPSFKGLISLTHMDLQGCKSLEDLPKSICELKCLIYLDLDGCGSLMELPKSVGELKSLQHLNLSGCGALQELPLSIGRLRFLQHLNLSGCGALQELPFSIGGSGFLQHLDLSGCGGLESLQYLNLSGCGVLQELPFSIGGLKSLQHLNLSGCGALQELPFSIGGSGFLQHLDLSGCGALQELPFSIGGLESLQHLNLNGCGALQELPLSIGGLGFLQYLNLSGCEVLQELPSSIGGLGYLQYLNLNGCRALQELPFSIGGLESLQYLNLSGCGVLQELPFSIGGLKSLQHLNLSGCGALQELPLSIGGLRSLQYLNLSGCEVLQELPSSIGGLGFLQYLNLNGCRALQELPESIGGLKYFVYFNIEGCKSLKELPKSISKLKLRRCQSITGMMMSTISEKELLCSSPMSLLHGNDDVPHDMEDEHEFKDSSAPSRQFADVKTSQSVDNKANHHDICSEKQLEHEDTRLFDPKISEGPATEVCASPSTSTTNQYQMEPKVENLRSPLNPMPNYDIFLSYFEEEKDFAKQLYVNLKLSNYHLLIDGDSNDTTKEELFTTSISEGNVNGQCQHQCQLAIIVLSKGYLTSKRSMLELSTLLKWKYTKNPTLKLCPLFYKLTPSDLDAKNVEVECGKSWRLLVQDGKVQEEEIVLWSKAVKFLLGAKNGESERTKALLDHLLQGKGNVEEFCSLFSEVVKDSWACDGLDFKEYGNSEVEYLSAVVEKICNNMPPVKESNTDEILGYQRMLEMQSKLSLQKMKSLLENKPLCEKQFLLQKGLNKAQSLQDKYIEWNTFEEMCSDNMNEKNNKLKHYGRGRITAALFPNAFLYYFKAMMLYEALHFVHDKDYLPLLVDAANMVAKRWKDLGGHEHQSFYIDVDACIDVGCISYLGGIVAMCKNFQEGQEVGRDLQTNIFRQYGIVQDDITGIYYCGRVEADLALGEPIHAEATGVIGVKFTSTSIHVEDLREDGSYYSGTLEDFSCEFGIDNNKDDPTHKQCAAKAFGDLEGASFLKNGSGIKCSPLLIIALASATQKKVLKLTWNDKYGHIKIDPNLPGLLQSLKLEVNQCEILFTDKISELGMAVEWGMNQAVVDSQRGSTSCNCNQVHQLGGAVDKGKKQIAYDLQRCDTTRNSIQVQNIAAVYQAATQNKKKFGVEAKGLGSGGTINWEIQSSQTKKISEQSERKLIEYHWRDEGGYVERIVLHKNHEDIKALLLQGALFAAKLNYLVVYDNNREGHVSIYCAKDGQNEDELEWITDIFLKVGSEDREKIFKLLKGRDLTIKRSCTDYTIVPANRLAKGSPSSYLSKFFQEKIGRNKNCIVKEKLIELPEFGSRSNNEWEHFIGPQEGFTEEKKFWWEATFMEAIICSRTRFSTGNLMTTRTTDERFRRIGHCSRKFDFVISDEYILGAFDVETRGKFSKAPASQRENYVKWGGLSNLDLQ